MCVKEIGSTREIATTAHAPTHITLSINCKYFPTQYKYLLRKTTHFVYILFRAEIVELNQWGINSRCFYFSFYLSQIIIIKNIAEVPNRCECDIFNESLFLLICQLSYLDPHSMSFVITHLQIQCANMR